MKLYRFLIPNFNFQEKEAAIADAALIHQIRNILRLQKGEAFVVFNEEGKEAIVRILAIARGALTVKVEHVGHNQNEPENRVVLYVALLKKDNFEWVVQKATEIGAAAIVPLLTSRTVKMNFNNQRMAKIVREAAEQSGRFSLLSLADPLLFSSALNNHDCETNIFFDPSGTPFSLKELSGSKKRIGVWIGPEGGWSPEEVLEARQRSFAIVSLGPLVLRAETAAVVGCYLAANL